MNPQYGMKRLLKKRDWNDLNGETLKKEKKKMMK
jgi:hypothetical protein